MLATLWNTSHKEPSTMYIILVYDIQVQRVAKVCKYLRQHLNWIQNSVFEGQLTKAQLARVKSGLARTHRSRTRLYHYLSTP